MTLQFANSVRDNFTRRRRQAELAVRAAKMPAEERAEYERIGFNAAPFAVNPQPEVQLAMAVLLGQLRRCQDVCKQHGMLMRVVTVPAFPKAFYDSQHGSEWTMKIGNYDYLKPEREIADFARTNGIPCLAMGEYIHNRKLDVEEIRSMYFAGVGHLTEKGHRFWAQAMFDTFYQTTRP
jgi:hypothetical protein